MSQKNSEIFPELIFPLDSIALEDSIVSKDFLASEDSIVSEDFLASGDSLVSEDFLASGDSLVLEDFFTSGNNFTSEDFLAPQEIDVDPLTGMAKNPTIDASDVAASGRRGRRTVIIQSIECIKAGADSDGEDEIYIALNGTKIWGSYGMEDGEIRRVNAQVQYRGETNINVWDEDSGWWSSDDRIGGPIRVNGFSRSQTRRLTESGSEYLLRFRST